MTSAILVSEYFGAALLKIIFVPTASVSDYCLPLASHIIRNTLRTFRINSFAELIRKPINLPFCFIFRVTVIRFRNVYSSIWFLWNSFYVRFNNEWISCTQFLHSFGYLVSYWFSYSIFLCFFISFFFFLISGFCLTFSLPSWLVCLPLTTHAAIR